VLNYSRLSCCLLFSQSQASWPHSVKPRTPLKPKGHTGVLCPLFGHALSRTPRALACGDVVPSMQRRGSFNAAMWFLQRPLSLRAWLHFWYCVPSDAHGVYHRSQRIDSTLIQTQALMAQNSDQETAENPTPTITGSRDLYQWAALYSSFTSAALISLR